MSFDSQALGGRALLRLDKSKQAAGKRFRGNDRSRRSPPLRRFQRHSDTKTCPLIKRFGMDSKPPTGMGEVSPGKYLQVYKSSAFAANLAPWSGLVKFHTSSITSSFRSARSRGPGN